MVPRRQRILWVDDEIDMLKPHILYLEGKGYRVTAVSNGFDALQLVDEEEFDIVLLDEMMPGMGGLAVLEGIKERRSSLPVVMITKSEEENLMNEALGHRITDYLIKPVNPSQIFLACKKIFEARGLERGTSVREYVRQFSRGRDAPLEEMVWEQWAAESMRAIRWDLELDSIAEEGLRESHGGHLEELNRHFCHFVEENYQNWVADRTENRPMLSPDVVPRRIVPLLRDGRKAALIVIDCMRLDQWLLFESLIPQDYRIEREAYCSILPTATPYARNAIFSGLYPARIAEQYPQFWEEAQHSETSKNRFERELLLQMLAREGVGTKRVQYTKVVTRKDADDLINQVGSFADLDLVSMVFTFVDTFTHGRSRDAILAEFAQDVGALRAHLRTWFERSVVLDVIREMSRQGRVIVVTTDHGNVQVKRPAAVGADRHASPGTRFKVGRALTCDPDQGLLIQDPPAFGLPEGGILKTYLFAKEDHFFVYPRRRHEHERTLRESFQHGGISIEEMIVPLATLHPTESA